MFMDIKRMCENPTDEDKEWFPDLAGKDWNEAVHFAMLNFKDESFIQQFLSPKVIRDFHFFSVIDDRFPPSRWNIYACQCSDGDNWTADCPSAKTSLESKILPLAQYFAYVEIIPKELGQGVGELWPLYEQIKAGHKNFDMASIRDVADIYPVFRGLFEKRD